MRVNYRELLERFADVVIVADASDHIVYANAACEVLLGWPADMLINQPLTVIQPPRMHAKHKAGFKRYFRTHEARILNKPIRVPALRRDGTELELELTMSTQPVAAGEELIVGCLRDLSDRVELERQQLARSEAEIRAERAEFLDEAGRELASSLDYEATLTRIARLAVAGIADWCIIDMADAAGLLGRLAVTHSDPAKEAMAAELTRRYPPAARRTEAGAARVARTGAAELVGEIPDAMLSAIAQDDEHLDLLRGLGLASYISVPLKARGHTLGVLTCIAAESKRRYGADDLVLLEGLARHAGQAIDNARLFGELETEVAKRKQQEARLARLSRLYAVLAEMNEAIVRVHDQTNLFAELCRIVVESGEFRMAWVGLLDPGGESLRPVARHGAETENYLASLELSISPGARHLPLVARAVREGRPTICNDIATDAAIRPWREQALACGYRGVAVLPLRIRAKVIGTFNVYASESDFFDVEGVRLFTDIAEDVSFALEALDWERRRAEAEEALRGERAFLATLLQNLKDGIVACDAHGSVSLFNRAACELHGLPAEPALPKHWSEQPYELLQPESGTRMRQTEKPLYRALAGESFREVEMVIAPASGDRRVVVCSGQPLYNGTVRQVGAVITLHDVTARKQAEARLLRQAFHDPLTGLANRRLLIDRLRHALALGKRQPSSLAVLFIDLDRLKVINDSFGHEVGDQVLVIIAERLCETVRSADSVARLGGDEFVVVCEDLADEDEAVALSHRLETAVCRPCVLDELDAEVVMTASIGIALARGDERAEDLLRNADAAMYEAKQRGKARHALFDDALRSQAVERLNAEHALRRAIEENRLRLAYQPIIDLKDARLIGAEALVRYHDPERGLIMPKEFLDIAEESGLILPLGNWVLAEACRQTCQWRKILPGFQISINLSTRQIGEPGFMETLNNALTHDALPPGAVGLEITESVLMEAANSTQRILQQFKDYGPRLGMDDFGTGYSSLTYLRRFPVDFVKIDRSFVRGIGQNTEDTAIVTAVINLGKALGLTSIAEGVETAHQAALLRRLGCDFAQGFYFARPQPADEFTTLLHHPPAWLLDA